jgi:hypothetical protein
MSSVCSDFDLGGDCCATGRKIESRNAPNIGSYDFGIAARRLLWVLGLFPSSPEGKECHVREHIRQLIEEARLPQVATDGDGNRTVQSLGTHALRLARVAAAMHLHDAVQCTAEDDEAFASTLVEVRS